MMTQQDSQRQQREADRLYARYGRPLEGGHWGEYVAIHPNGTTILAPTLVEAVTKASAKLGLENFVFKTGERVVGSWR